MPSTLLIRPFRFLSLNAAPVQAGVLPSGSVGSLPQYQGPGTPRELRWDYTFTGTALGAVVVNLEGNDISDTFAGTWEVLDTGNTPAGEAGRSVVNKNPLFVRARVAQAAGGDGTSTITTGIRTN